MFTAHPEVPLFPISSSADLVPLLVSIQTHHNQPSTRCPPQLPHLCVNELVPWLVSGPRLSEARARQLSDSFGSLGDLCKMVHSRQGLRRLVDCLGEADARRVMEYLTTEMVIW